MEMTRRDLVTAGAVGVASAIAGTIATAAGPASAAAAHTGGVHIYAPLKIISPEAMKDFSSSTMFTLWGPDDALHGIGWGATTEGGDEVQSYAGASLFPCVFAADGAINGDVVKLKATQIFTGNRVDQGWPWFVEASLTTGFVRAVEIYEDVEFVLEGTGVAVRI